MTSALRHLTVDCHNSYAQGLFWSAATGFTEDPDNPNLPDHDESLLVGPDGHPGLLFINVPGDEKVVKNRIHFDLQPTERTRDEEVARLIDLGASLVADQRRPDGTGWVVLADPEGNEFCVERSVGERTAAAS